MEMKQKHKEMMQDDTLQHKIPAAWTQFVKGTKAKLRRKPHSPLALFYLFIYLFIYSLKLILLGLGNKKLIKKIKTPHGVQFNAAPDRNDSLPPPHLSDSITTVRKYFPITALALSADLIQRKSNLLRCLLGAGFKLHCYTALLRHTEETRFLFRHI